MKETKSNRLYTYSNTIHLALLRKQKDRNEKQISYQSWETVVFEEENREELESSATNQYVIAVTDKWCYAFVKTHTNLQHK